jgi:hypothetical protein
MYYCYRSKSTEYSAEKIQQRMEELRIKIPEVSELPATGEPDIINGLDLSHPVAELIVEYRVLTFWLENPPDPRGEKMCCRVPPYFIHVSTKDLALALGLHYKTVERAKKLVHETLDLKIRADITVDEFCMAMKYPQEVVDKVHQNLAYIREGKWKQLIDLQKKKEEEE